ncbi:hypothetical protein QJS66_18540 [Kocuria rhizophila]|nr:hypothetical protein QJS66_18540 [Kocuria rhizophila]
MPNYYGPGEPGGLFPTAQRGAGHHAVQTGAIAQEEGEKAAKEPMTLDVHPTDSVRRVGASRTTWRQDRRRTYGPPRRSVWPPSARRAAQSRPPSTPSQEGRGGAGQRHAAQGRQPGQRLHGPGLPGPGDGHVVSMAQNTNYSAAEGASNTTYDFNVDSSMGGAAKYRWAPRQAVHPGRVDRLGEAVKASVGRPEATCGLHKWKALPANGYESSPGRTARFDLAEAPAPGDGHGATASTTSTPPCTPWPRTWTCRDRWCAKALGIHRAQTGDPVDARCSPPCWADCDISHDHGPASPRSPTTA